MDMQNLIEMLKRHEGEVVTNGRHLIYKCSAGHWTIGIGRNGRSVELASMIATGEYPDES